MSTDYFAHGVWGIPLDGELRDKAAELDHATELVILGVTDESLTSLADCEAKWVKLIAEAAAHCGLSNHDERLTIAYTNNEERRVGSPPHDADLYILGYVLQDFPHFFNQDDLARDWTTKQLHQRGARWFVWVTRGTDE